MTAAEKDYLVTVRVVETFTVKVSAMTSGGAEWKVRSGEYDEGDAAQNGDRKWTSVKARLDV